MTDLDASQDSHIAVFEDDDENKDIIFEEEQVLSEAEASGALQIILSGGFEDADEDADGYAGGEATLIEAENLLQKVLGGAYISLKDIQHAEGGSPNEQQDSEEIVNEAMRGLIAEGAGDAEGAGETSELSTEAIFGLPL